MYLQQTLYLLAHQVLLVAVQSDLGFASQLVSIHTAAAALVVVESSQTLHTESKNNRLAHIILPADWPETS